MKQSDLGYHDGSDRQGKRMGVGNMKWVWNNERNAWGKPVLRGYNPRLRRYQLIIERPEP